MPWSQVLKNLRGKSEAVHNSPQHNPQQEEGWECACNKLLTPAKLFGIYFQEIDNNVKSQSIHQDTEHQSSNASKCGAL